MDYPFEDLRDYYESFDKDDSAIQLFIDDLDKQINFLGNEFIVIGGGRQSFRSHILINILYPNLIAGKNCILVSMDWSAKEVYQRIQLLHINNPLNSFGCTGLTWDDVTGRARRKLSDIEVDALEECRHDLVSNPEYGKLMVIDTEYIEKMHSVFSFDTLKNCIYVAKSKMQSCDILAVDSLNRISSYYESDYKEGRKLLEQTFLFFSELAKTLKRGGAAVVCIYDVEDSIYRQIVKEEQILSQTIWKRKNTRSERLEDISFKAGEKAVKDAEHLVKIESMSISEEEKKLFRDDILERKKEHQEIVQKQTELSQAEEDEDNKELARLKGCYDICDFASPEIIISKSDVILSVFWDAELREKGVIRMQLLKNGTTYCVRGPIEVPVDISTLRVGHDRFSGRSVPVSKKYWRSILGDESGLSLGGGVQEIIDSSRRIAKSSNQLASLWDNRKDIHEAND